MTCPPAPRWAWAEIDVDAIGHNVGVLRRAVAPAGVWAVVKADGYGHGSVVVARAAVEAGCDGLCVALTAEGVALREAGLDVPILVLSEQPAEHGPTLVAHRLTPTVTSTAGIDALADLRPDGLGVHLKVDTGMHRIGAQPADVPALVSRIAGHAPQLRLAGIFTHLAVADEPGDPYTAGQLATLTAVLAALPPAVLDGVAVHAANSAGGLAHPASRHDFVRAGIAVYGISPGPEIDELARPLRPALALKARVSHVKRLAAGERLSYGLRYTLPVDANVATVPLGYADGVRRNLSNNGDVLIGGRRRPIIGNVTMDQLMVGCGDDPVQRGDEVVLIGTQGDERITAEEWGIRLGSIGYEVVCGIGPRVPRLLVGVARRP
ncbi:MAG: alanine racemase [Ilumatobacteraceae bacterium]